MNATAVVIAIAGIVGTLLAPVIGRRTERANRRENRLLEQRLTAYTHLLEIAGHIRENAQTWSAIPLADPPQPPSGRIRSIDARIRVIGSEDVREATDRVATLSTRFYGLLWDARRIHQRVDAEEADSAEAIVARMNLGGLADEMKDATGSSSRESGLR